MNIQSYLTRIAYQGSLEPSLQTLTALQATHMRTVPFENMSVSYKEPIILTEAWLYNKIVERNRGGFCYELNGLFAWLLRELGFRVSMLSAGVMNGEGEFGAEFDHMTLLVHLDEEYLVDVGFGDSFRTPLRFNYRGAQSQNGMSYQISAQNDAFVLSEQNEREQNPSMRTQYRFTQIPHQMKEYEDMCKFHQTSPQSMFTQKRICSRATENGRLSLTDLKLIVTENGNREETLLSSEKEFEAVLKKHFNIDLQPLVRNSIVDASK